MTMITGCISGTSLCAADTSGGTLSVSAVFSDNMVLQQGKETSLFGFGAADSNISVTVERDGKAVSASGKTDADGYWKLLLPEQEASFSPAVITVTSGSETITLSNVLFGQVWVCAGQSNMQFSVDEAQEADEVQNSNRHDYIRFFRQSGDCAPNGKVAEPSGVWETAVDWENVKKCSAVGYFFAEKLAEECKSPVGIIIAAVGGTSIATWLSKDIVESNPQYKNQLEKYGLTWNPEVWATSYAYYNAYIAPFSGFRAAGILWYQGEADVHRYSVLENGIILLAECWSKVFYTEGKLMPLISVQLAPHAYQDNGCALANEEISKGISKVNDISGCAVTYPIYDVEPVEGEDALHPKSKRLTGERGAYYADKLCYNKQSSFCVPTAESAVLRDGNIYIRFTGVGDGLQLRKGRKLVGCVISYRDGSYVKVAGKITGKDTIAIETDGDKPPLAVGYAFYEENADANLVSSDGVPPLAFRMEVAEDESDSSVSVESIDNHEKTERKAHSPIPFIIVGAVLLTVGATALLYLKKRKQ